MRQKLKIALQMDPLERLDLKGDTTFILGLEAINRGFEVYFYSPNDLTYKNGFVYANIKTLDLAFSNGKEKFSYGKEKILNLEALKLGNFGGFITLARLPEPSYQTACLLSEYRESVFPQKFCRAFTRPRVLT